ncbi:hypothetical protein HBI73_212060 [Parastagonospora nodorum]|nr:hypothetical protein HBH52_021670 [Parastagonospora nodorum]KAH4013042.1 hypothetical protein HBI09_218630 [Parastagonospora nodorum]KAH4113134.1 hypothetical protein HBH47_215400 [Parastagonospora nodorum]KAH4154739.1 hypothetical protein HBH43_215740 [Parastagonospora nodorum]KAH4975177.1 hypothetical protein HBI77_228620 [Parastagonospora nodorum]
MTRNIRVSIAQNSHNLEKVPCPCGLPSCSLAWLGRLLTGAPSHPEASARLVTLPSYPMGRTTSWPAIAHCWSAASS